MFRDLTGSRELAWRLFVRDVRAQYRQSVLGIVWAFLPALLTALLFILLESSRVIDLGETAIPYPAFVLIGTTYWQVFLDALNAPLKSVGNAKQILCKVNFPREALILSAACSVAFNALLKCVVLVPFLLYFDVPPVTGMLLAPLAVGVLALLGLALGLLLTPIGMLYTDVASGLAVLTPLWFFATPVVYPTPATFPASLLSTLNPVSPFLNAARDLTALGTLQDPIGFAALCAAVMVALVGAWLVYRLAIPVLVERMSA